MSKKFIFLYIVLQNFALSPDNGSIPLGTALFGASVGLVIAHQKINTIKYDSEHAELAQKIISENNLNNYVANQRSHNDRQEIHIPKKISKDYPPSLLPSQNKHHVIKTYPSSKTTDDIDNIQKIDLSLPEGLEKKIERIQRIEEINKYYRENNIPSILDTTNQYFTTFTQDKESDNSIFSNQKDQLKSGYTATQHIITPKNTTTKNIIILPIVHGTWTNHASHGGNQDDLLSKAYFAYARFLALKYNAIIHFHAIKWDGDLTQECRKEAGVNLANELKEEYQKIKSENPCAKIDIKPIGHSHGCNVINHASHILQNNELTIDEAIFFGCPGFDVEPHHIKKVFNFMGKNDGVTPIGKILHNGILQPSTTLEENENIKNITLKLHGQDLNHAGIYTLINYLPLIKTYLDQNFKDKQYLICDIFNQKQRIETDQNIIIDHNDDDDLVTHESAENAIPDYAINGFIDQSKEKLKEKDRKSMISQENENKFIEMYNQSPYVEPNTIQNVIQEIVVDPLSRLWNAWNLK